MWTEPCQRGLGRSLTKEPQAEFSCNGCVHAVTPWPVLFVVRLPRHATTSWQVSSPATANTSKGSDPSLWLWCTVCNLSCTGKVKALDPSDGGMQPPRRTRRQCMAQWSTHAHNHERAHTHARTHARTHTHTHERAFKTLPSVHLNVVDQHRQGTRDVSKHGT